MFLLLDGCVDRINLSTDEETGTLVIEGTITDQPGPYRIHLARASNINDILNLSQPYIADRVTIFDDEGNEEVLSTSGNGIYETSPDGIQGVVGRKYTLSIQSKTGTVFESEPQELKPVAAIDSIYFNFESYQPIKGPTEHGFRIFMDSQTLSGTEYFVRWRFTGTYKLRSYPESHRKFGPCVPGPPDPLPCSGFVFEGSILKRITDCTCCECWVNEYEDKPRVNQDVIEVGGKYKGIEVGFVPFNQWTFLYNKYMVKVEQMSLSREAHEFWKIIEDQKNGATSLFQPSFGRLKSNVFSTNSDEKAFGIFYASSIRQKILFITGKDAPISVPQPDIPPENVCNFEDACDIVFFNASRTPPPEWE